MHEILTIQCGNTANYIGTHFWNLQDPTNVEQSSNINHDVLFSAGQARNGMATYTPRLLIYDRARNFGSMKRINALYAEPETPMPESQIISSEDKAREHPFQQSLEQDQVPDGSLLNDSNVAFWSDYNTQFYRPETYLPLDSTASTTTNLESFDSGRELYHSRTASLDILDSDIRPFLEQCDLLQGFNVLTDFESGWSGFSSALAIDLTSEFPKSFKFYVTATAAAASPPPTHASTTRKAESLSTSLAVHAIHEEVDAIVPLFSTMGYSGSASAGLWLDSLTVPLRTLQRPCTVPDMLSFLEPRHTLFGARLDRSGIGQIDGRGVPDRVVQVLRGQSDETLETKRILDGGGGEGGGGGGGLNTTFGHKSSVTFPTAFPDKFKGPGTASLIDSARGTVQYLKQMREMVAGIRGAEGYTDRKELNEEMVELAGRYQSELFCDSDASSDDDGF